MMLVTIAAGPTLHVWRDGQEVARVPLDTPAALALVAALAAEVRAKQARGEVAKHGGDRVSKISDQNLAPSPSDLGLRRDENHEARR